MINHARTLLMNVSASSAPLTEYPGEEAIGQHYTALELPTYLDTLRVMLFGSDPDRLMLNYRVRQYLSVLHSGPLEEFVLRLDPRITYDLRDDAFIAEETFKPKVTAVQVPTGAKLSVIGRPDSPDSTGRMRHTFLVDVVDTTSLRLSRTTQPVTNVLLDFAVTGGLSGLVTLPGTGYSFRLSNDGIPQTWQISVVNRPTTDLSQIVAGLQAVGEPVLLSLFGLTKEEPWLTFKNLWEQKEELPLKLGGLLCAIIYRTEERRRSLG